MGLVVGVPCGKYRVRNDYLVQAEFAVIPDRIGVWERLSVVEEEVLSRALKCDRFIRIVWLKCIFGECATCNIGVECKIDCTLFKSPTQ